ncbi:MAG: hypothetical protein Ct9H300mP4_11360 [Gammaproteobacteria bacterium]|nr:MAG: hypothetical protein Ct9H300mP4_11360 [Gammaproteobacteria bacterium]
MAFYSGTTKKNMSLFGMAPFLALMVYQSNLITKLAKQGENKTGEAPLSLPMSFFWAFINLVWQLLQNLGHPLTSADKQENKLLLNNLRIDQNGNKKADSVPSPTQA